MMNLTLFVDPRSAFTFNVTNSSIMRIDGTLVMFMGARAEALGCMLRLRDTLNDAIAAFPADYGPCHLCASIDACECHVSGQAGAR